MGRECSPALWQHLQRRQCATLYEALAQFSTFVTLESGVICAAGDPFRLWFCVAYPPREPLSHVYVKGGNEGLRWHGIIVVRRCHHGSEKWVVYFVILYRSF